MTISQNIIEIEGQRGILQILLILYNNGDVLYRELYNIKPQVNISNNITAQRALELLQKHDLIYKKERKERKAYYYCLTDKGKKFVKCINQMQHILDE